ncbi:hypothetical protein E3N88_44288 [Mikania micrantha]|uniref:Uncharacterized protein n=1 Tax=Mikania micrantha TaxID=192012 RepID=A0A5N6LCE8_9ASTR|nr:hypothetical protein E3N88_44288 [Mikania micrantha]
MASNGFLKVEEGCSRAPGSVMGCQAYRLTLVGMMCRYARIRYRRGAQIPPARIACRGLPGSGVERVNRSLVEGLKKRLEETGSSWVDELPSVLWAYRTMPKTSNGESPFRLTYRSEAMIPAEIGSPSQRVTSVGVIVMMEISEEI